MTYYMVTRPVDREVLEAAQTLCMLAVDNRPQQDVNRDKAQDDECIITHVRPVAHRQQEVKEDETEDEDVSIITQVRQGGHRYHPYTIPEPKQPRLTVDRSRVLPNRDADGEWMEISGCTLPPLAQSPAPFHQGPAVFRKPLPSQKPAPVQDSTNQGSSRKRGENTFPTNTYTWRALCLQALLTAPAGEWMGVTEMIESLADKYPNLFEKYYDERHHKISRNICQALEDTLKRYTLLEKLERPALRNKWRVAPAAREDATTMAWVKKPVPSSKV